MGDTNDHPDEEKQIAIRWPLSTGADAKFAHMTAVTSVITMKGPMYLLEFGSWVPSGTLERDPAEVNDYLRGTPVNVVARILVPADTLIALRGFIDTRLDVDRKSGALKEEAK